MLISGLLIISQLARSTDAYYEALAGCRLMGHMPALLAHGDATVRARSCNLLGNLCRHRWACAGAGRFAAAASPARAAGGPTALGMPLPEPPLLQFKPTHAAYGWMFSDGLSACALHVEALTRQLCIALLLILLAPACLQQPVLWGAGIVGGGGPAD